MAEEKYIRNLEHGTPLELKEQVQYMKGQIVSRTLAQDAHRSLTLFAFDKGEEISTHASDGDAMVIALEGAGQITIDGREQVLQAGQTIVMPARIPHAVLAVEPFKMLLLVVFPESRGDA